MQAVLATAELILALPAIPASLRPVRSKLAGWLREKNWPFGDAEDLELAVSEAVANVIDHAYPPDARGDFSVHAWVSRDRCTGRRRVTATVIDRGRWATHHPDAGAAPTRGFGLVVMTGCVAHLHIDRSPGGTTVILVSPAIPPAG